MKNRWVLLFCMISVMGLLGCQWNSREELVVVEEEQETEDIDSEITMPVIIAPEEIIQEEPGVIKIIDPNTFEIIHTFLPEDLGYDVDIGEYLKNIEQFAKELARGTETETGYDKRMVLDRLDENGQIIKGSPMILLKESELVQRILSVSESGGNVELPLHVTESNYNIEDVAHLEKVVIASYTTYFNTTDAGRTKNIELSAQAINNIIVGNGDYFSFNTMVGPRDAANGYQPAPEIINKKLVIGIGGGICQTSSTLFNAVDQVSINILERHYHSLNIEYVPKGRDATVAYGTLDFRFQNTGSPFIIKTIFGKGFLTVELRTSEKYKP